MLQLATEKAESDGMWPAGRSPMVYLNYAYAGFFSHNIKLRGFLVYVLIVKV